MQNVSLECSDALKVIRNRDDKNTLFYIDPPYYNSDMGHYDGYTLEDYGSLLKTLATIQGKFILSSYPSSILTEYTEKNGWKTECYQSTIAIQNTTKRSKRGKIEVLTRNY